MHLLRRYQNDFDHFRSKKEKIKGWKPLIFLYHLTAELTLQMTSVSPQISLPPKTNRNILRPSNPGENPHTIDNVDLKAIESHLLQPHAIKYAPAELATL